MGDTAIKGHHSVAWYKGTSLMTSQTQSQDWLYRNPVPGKQHRYNTDITEHSLYRYNRAFSIGKNGQKSALLSLEIMNVICKASFVCIGKA